MGIKERYHSKFRWLGVALMILPLLSSCIREEEDEITDRIYMNYHKHMLRLAVTCNAQEKVVNHYRKAVTRYEYLLPFYDYLLILKPRNKFQAWVLKMKYILGILMVKIG